FYRLREAALLPRPQRPGGPRILMGGNGPRRILPLVALYADIWNAVSLTPGEFRERSELLDKLLIGAGRKPEDVRRTMMRAVFFGRDRAELERRLRPFVEQPEYAGKAIDDIVHSMITQHHEIAGTADMIIEQIKAYEAAGVEELMLQWFDFEDIDGLRAFAASVLPHV
ncbi:MAG: LLM class flavin-dependent oxidoreductase, partial [Ktedonobacteraceae bacterium]